MQRRYRESAPELAVPSRCASAGTVAVAADWLLRFLIHPEPDLAGQEVSIRAARADFRSLLEG